MGMGMITAFRRFVYLIFLLFFGFGYASAQTTYTASVIENEDIKKHLDEVPAYQLIALETEQLYERAHTATGLISFMIEINGELIPFQVFRQSVRGADVKSMVITPNGAVEQENSASFIYKTESSLNTSERQLMVIDKDLIAASFNWKGKHYIIEPYRWHVTEAASNLFMLYESSIVQFLEEAKCGADDLAANKNRKGLPFGIRIDLEEIQENLRAARPCRLVEYGAALDWSFVSKYGGNSGAYNRVNFVMGLVETQYTDAFNWDFVFIRTAEFASACSTCDPWSNSNDAGTVLGSFRNWGQANGFQGQTFDVAGLWTNRVFNGGTVGIAYVGGMCSSNRYHALRDFSNASWAMRVMVSHEIGHNLNYGHDAQGSNFIMAPSVTNTTIWSTPSRTTINNFVNGNGGNCLGPCPENCVNFEVDYSVVHTTCSQNNGGFTISVSGGQPPYRVNIGNGFVQQTSFNNLAPGVYTAVVRDNGTCEETVVIEVLPSINVQFNMNVFSTTCGIENGAIVINVTQGRAPFLHDIGFGFTPQNNFVNLPPGTYTVEVLDNDGCLNTQVATIADSEPFITDFTVVHTNCGHNNGRITIAVINGGRAPFQYGVNGIYRGSPVFDSLPAGNYLIEVIDADGCFSITTGTINPSAGITASASTIPSACGGANGSLTVTVSQGIPPYTYTLNGVTQSNNTFRNLAPGNYTAMVTDNSGCTRNVQANVANSSTLSLTASSQGAWCGLSQGKITVNVQNGRSPFEYNFGNGFQADNFAENLAAGTYTVQVRDSANCPGSINVTVATSPEVNVTAQSTPSDCIVSDGTVRIIATGGTPPFMYQLGPNQSQNPLFVNIGPGVYVARATDSLGCFATVLVTVESESDLSLAVDTDPANCGRSDGEARAVASGGTPPYSYDIGNGPQVNGVFSNLAAGTYSLRVIDATDCFFQTFITIDGFPAIVIDSDLEATTCGKDNGSASFDVSGGNGQYSYFLNGVQVQTTNFSNLASGSYTFRVTDTAGCETTKNFRIEPSSGMNVNVIVVFSSCENPNGAVQAEVSGGYPPYSYNLGQGAQSQNRFNGLAAGNYILVITDDENCSISRNIVVGNDGVKPQAAFSAVRNGFEVRFRNQSGGDPSGYAWTFGDGNTSIDPNPVHRYEELKEYEVCLKVQNSCGENTVCQTFTLNGLRDCAPNDSLALVALFEATAGDSWTISWDLEQPIVDWEGLTFHADGCLLGLDLPSNGLEGSLPESIGDFLAIEWINIADNTIGGSIPSTIGYLSSLKLLNISQNELTGNFPNTFNRLINLEHLNLANNKFEGDLQDLIYELLAIQYLNLSHNQLFGTIKQDLASLKRLGWLDLSHNNLSGMVPDVWNEIPQIHTIYLNNNRLEGAFPGSITQVDSLSALWISNNMLSNIPDMSAMDKWVDLEEKGLRVENNKLTFTHLIPNQSLLEELQYRRYAPQAKVYRDTTLRVSMGSPLELNIGVDENITGTNYQWYRNGLPVQSSLVPVLAINNLQGTDLGVYHVEITNPNLPELTLRSYDITLDVVSSISNTEEQLEFILAPNPVFANGGFWVELRNFKTESKAIDLVVMNMEGKVVRSNRLETQHLLIRQWMSSPGIAGQYFVAIQSEGRTIAVRKLVVY
jgi:PKD repeat protein/Leucine-rich repeat (LRR) protein